jgi:CrcB protein
MPRTLAMALWVAVLGAAGSLARWGLGAALARVTAAGSFVPTMVVNLAGCFLMGLAVTLLAPEGGLRSPLGVGVTAGLMGGFTTYSAYAYQTFDLIEKGRWGAAVANVALTLLGCLALCWVGVVAGRGLRG